MCMLRILDKLFSLKPLLVESTVLGTCGDNGPNCPPEDISLNRGPPLLLLRPEPISGVGSCFTSNMDGGAIRQGVYVTAVYVGIFYACIVGQAAAKTSLQKSYRSRGERVSLQHATPVYLYNAAGTVYRLTHTGVFFFSVGGGLCSAAVR